MNIIFFKKNLIINLCAITSLIVIFWYINYFLKDKEHMSIENTELIKILEKDGYDIDTENLVIKKCNNKKCIEKKYSTKHFNSKESHKLAKNKPESNTIFANNNIPVPKHIIINDYNKDNFINNNKIEFPSVLKPVDGMQGIDVNTFIKNIDQFNEILNNLLKKYDKVMFENQVYGENYRIFIFNNKIMDIVKREQPYVIGDGYKKVLDLIVERNNFQKYNGLFPTTNIDWNYIKEQGYNKDSLVNKNNKVFITNTINFHNGATVLRIDLEKVPKINKDMFLKAHKLINLECSGIDYMSPDIYIPYNDNNGHIIEINDMVDTYIHVRTDADNPDFLYQNISKSF
jgi:glutathione synthase/RimK-type ligase-like ATP-grasp enzyme